MTDQPASEPGSTATPQEAAPQETLPPLPGLTSAEWWALPSAERARLKQLKRMHKAMEAGQVKAGPPQQLNEDATPFRDHANRPLHLNIGRGGQCFIVLCGPSLLTLDLGLLGKRGVYTIGVNNSPALWRPNAWVFVDPPDKFHESIWLDPAVMKLVHWRFLQDRRFLRHKNPDGTFSPLQIYRDGRQEAVTTATAPGVVGMIRNAYFHPDRWLAESSVNWGSSAKSSSATGMERCLNVMFASIKAAYSLGFRTVYLLGCDFNMSPNDRAYAFDEKKDAGGCASNMNAYSTMNRMFSLLAPSFAAAGYRVFNTNKSSGLTVFPYLPYHKAIEAATAHVPQDPLDTRDWYLKN